MSFLFSSSIALVQFLKIVQLERPFFLISGFLLWIPPCFGHLSTCFSQLLIFFTWNKLDHFIFPPKTLPYHYLCYKAQNLAHRTYVSCNRGATHFSTLLFLPSPRFGAKRADLLLLSTHGTLPEHGALNAPPHLLLLAIFHHHRVPVQMYLIHGFSSLLQASHCYLSFSQRTQAHIVIVSVVTLA